MKKVILISGGSSGLGYEMAKMFSAGNVVVISSNNKQGLLKAARQLKCDFEFFDVSDVNGVKKAVQNVIKKHGRLDCLINNAGIWIEGKLEDNDPAYVKRVMEVNALGPILLSQAVIPQMKKQKSGTILNVISQAGLCGKEERSVYHASKFAVTGLTKCLELELKKHGIRVIGLYPGFMKTKFFEKTGVKKNMAAALDPKETAKLVKFMVESDPKVNFPEAGIKFTEN